MEQQAIRRLAQLCSTAVLLLALTSASADTGRLRRVQIPSAAIGTAPHALIALPPADRTPAGSLYLLHGAGCDPDTWRQICNLQALAGSIRRVIIVPSPGPHSWYIDSPTTAGVAAASFLVDELVPHVDRMHPAAARSRWISGFSMGGYGALRIGLANPHVFSAVGALSPCITPSRWKGKWHLDEMMGPARATGGYDLLDQTAAAALAHAGERQALSIVCGRFDFFYPENADLHSRLTNAGVTHHWWAPVGWHTIDFWARALPTQVRYLEAREAMLRPPLRKPAEDGQ